MCCFSAKTEVRGTRIFARLTAPDTQALVYQMQYAAAQPTAMILPLPVATPATDATVAWKSLKEYPSFFEDLAAGFAEAAPQSPSGSKSVRGAAPLPVHEVGDFVASFVPSVNDFDRIDPRFVIAKDVWAAIPEYRDYGFAVFQLKQLSGSPHPIAFEFRTRLRDAVFLPTVHIHDGTVHREDAFDHALYVQDTRLDARQANADGFVGSSDQASAFTRQAAALGLVDGSLHVHRKLLSGIMPNKDTFVDVKPGASVGCNRCDAGAAGAQGGAGSVSLALATLGWIIHRRNERQRGSMQ